MKKLFCTVSLLLILISASFGQDYPPFYFQIYQDAWDQVDKNIKEKKPNEALVIVDSIYARSKRANQHGHYLKAVLFQINATNYFDENAFQKSIDKLNYEIKTSREPQVQILYSVKADILWNYYQYNRYRILNRTNTINYQNEDVSTWDIRKLVNETIKAYQLSLRNDTLLKSTGLSEYDDIMFSNYEGREYRPTLYDFLVHRAINFFMYEEPELVRPEASFYLDNHQYLSPDDDFLSINITSPDSLSMKFYALQLLQDLIRFHRSDHNPKALIDVNLKRLFFVKENAVFENSDSLYVESLKSLFNKYPDNSEVASVCYTLADYYNTEASKYDSLKNPKPQNYYLEALKYIEYANLNCPFTIGSNNCQFLKNKITSSDIDITVEKYVASETAIKILVNFKNVDTLFTRIIPISISDYNALINKRSDEKICQIVSKLPFLSKSKATLPFPKDYQNRSVEIALPPLPQGHFLILNSNNENFDNLENVICLTEVTTTNFGWIERIREDGSFEIMVINRKTGKPVKNAKVKMGFEIDRPSLTLFLKQLIHRDEDADDYYVKNFTRRTNKNGQCHFPKIKTFDDNSDYESDEFYGYTISKRKDKIEINYNSIFNNFEPAEKIENEIATFFFTDRAIYRPGQTVYFKGITVNNTGRKTKLESGKTTIVKLLERNNLEKESLQLVTNDFGSFHGSFIVPKNGLSGRMIICNESGIINILVEEYKRPKFEAIFNPIKGSYRLNEKISATGIVKAYAGNMIDGATVKYRVTRQASYPWWRWYWGSMPYSRSMEIINGETITNEKGEYTINFNAIPDLNLNKDYFPQFNYTIYADITDINGETHSATTTVDVGYVSMSAILTMPLMIDQSKAVEKYDIRTTNLNYQLEPATVSVKITQLIHPKTFFNYRVWKKPTSYLYSREEYSKLFPYDQYYNELDKHNWAKGEVVYERSHYTASDTILQFENISKWKSGNYIIEITGVDKYGATFEKSKYFSVVNSEKKENSLYTGLQISTNEFLSEPGKTVKIRLESSRPNADVFIEYTINGKPFHKQWVHLKNNVKELELHIDKSLYGRISIIAAMVIENRIYSSSTNIYVPDRDLNLKINFATFRDKLSPGGEEEWRLTIKGNDGEKVASELLATMYDASLDAFEPLNWNPYFNMFNKKQRLYNYDENNIWTMVSFNEVDNDYKLNYKRPFGELKRISYEFIYPLNKIQIYHSEELKSIPGRSDQSPLLFYSWENTSDGQMGSVRGNRTDGTITYVDGVKTIGSSSIPKSAIQEINVAMGGVPAKYGETSGGILNITSSQETMPIQIRKNFNETAFFMPQLATDAEGNIVIKFKVPESLTRWKIMGLAHTKDLRIGQFTKELVTQKELMVVPNQPRFFREGDNMEFNAKISNISDKDLSGIAKIEFFDALTMKPINSELGLTTLEIPFSTLKGQSTSVAWKIAIPQGLMAITYRVTAQAGNFSDGEEMTLPVLTNRMLVTESLPLPINGNQTKTFSFDKLKNNTSTTLKNFKYTLEFTSNPAWYAIQALPYLMEYPYECSEQTFNRFYANSIATHIANSSPKIKAVFESWKINSPEALMSNLEKNQELKSLMLEETPWVLDAKNETEQKKRIGLLFDIINMSSQLDAVLDKLIKMQTSNGGWSWFPGMTESEYITQYIVTGFGHLKRIDETVLRSNPKIGSMIKNALFYLDNNIYDRYKDLKKRKSNMNSDNLNMNEIQYLYARTFFWKSNIVDSINKVAFDYYLNQSKDFWKDRNIYMQAMIAIVNFKTGDLETAKKIMASIKDRALYSEEMGMYWRNEGNGYFWYEAPIERQALLIEAFDLVNTDLESVEKMKIWLLKQKQTQNWGTTKSTAEACYALLLKGTSQLADDQLVEIKIGDKVIDPKKMDNVKVEAGTGYFKTAWNGTEITPNMGNITVTKSTAGVAWGSVYWQYFENLDKITPAATPLSMKKELFIVRATPTGEVIEPVKAGDKIKVGDKIRVRIVLRSDRDMEYVHMKDMRAAAFEPINVLSQYKYQDGLGYYESTRDAATNFFFDYLRKGTYVFEYSLFATQKGDFSNGITTIQCMYAPEFTSHSEGVRVVVE